MLALVMCAGVLILGVLAGAYGYRKLRALQEADARLENRQDQACTLADLDRMVQERVEQRVKEAMSLERRRLAEKHEELNGLIGDVQALLDTLAAAKQTAADQAPPPRTSVIRSQTTEAPSFEEIEAENQTVASQTPADDEPQEKRARRGDDDDSP